MDEKLWLGCGHAEETARAYASDWRLFEKWCLNEAVVAIPATPETVARFVRAHIDHWSSATISRRVAAIASGHRNTDVSDPTKSRVVKAALKGFFRKRGKRQKQAPGINFDLRSRMIAATPQTLIGRRNRALLAVAYDLGCRRSELVSIDVEDLEALDDGSCLVLLRRSKTDQEGQGQVRLIAKDSCLFVRDWLREARISTGALWRAVSPSGGIGGRLSPGRVSRIWKTMVAEIGERDLATRVSGHSTRVGMAQDMAAAGIDLASIMQAGGWRSPTMVARYTERLDARMGALARLSQHQKR